MISMDSLHADWDVIVMGGGPAGSTAATALARAGRKVLVLEKAKFPRFHVGESLLPYNRALFDELGLWEKISAAGFMVKRGAQFWMGDGLRHNRLDFSSGHFTEFPEALQVERAKFDQILLDHAREAGAEVREESLVLGHEVDDAGVTVKVRSADGSERSERGKFLIDASGLSNFTANSDRLREYYLGHKKVAIFRHFANVDMPQGDETGDILLVRRENSWFWLIPLEPGKTSVGLVMDAADFKALGKKPEEVFEEAVRTTPAMVARFQQAEALTAAHVAADFSYKNRALVSPRVVRVGDAAGFIDPIFSSGVMLAMNSGMAGARAVDEAIASGQAMTVGMRRYEKQVWRNIAVFWKFIERFYDHNFTQLFFQPVNRFRMVCAINCVLAGRTKLPFDVRWRLGIFFFLVRLNRLIPVVPRIRVG